jgi:hypothetical protein
MRESSVTTPERRQVPRTKLVEIAYIGMGPENGGLVLDVSDGGLSFHAVAPVRPAETIRFLLSFRSHGQIEGAGQVVWTNEMRTVCGLRFTSLSGGAREHLANWTNQSRMPVAARDEILSPAPPETPQTEESLPSLTIQSDTRVEPLFAIPPADDVYLSVPMVRAPWKEPLFIWILFGLLVAALTATAFFYGVHVGESESSSAARPVANPGVPAEPPTLAPTPAPASSVASEAPSVPTGAPAVPSDGPSVASDAPPAPNGAFVNASKPDDTSRNTGKSPGDDALGTNVSDQRAEQALAAGQSELTAALAYLQGSTNKHDSSKAAPLLWAAVGNGNSTAEVILADLYLRGDGVARSCEQGQVLLKAASKSGNLLADEKLQDLKAHRCR